ncbi:hypothetical protein RI367_006295 [Sorochytrium milnesiophthora]
MIRPLVVLALGLVQLVACAPKAIAANKGPHGSQVQNMNFLSPFLHQDIPPRVSRPLPGGKLSRRDDGPNNVQFLHGVASGDPEDTSVILWTKVTPSSPSLTVNVTYEVSDSDSFANIIESYQASTDASVDFTVKVEATNLQPRQHYWFRFRAGNNITSPVGRTKTLPSAGADLDQVNIAAVSCSCYPYGFFNAYRSMAARDLDLWLHLGDYIYEYGSQEKWFGESKIGRDVQPTHDLYTLEDYRTRHALYKGDADLQLLHATHPLMPIWDDHEFANDAWRDGAQNQDPNSPIPWSERRISAARAYFEYMPIRQVQADNWLRIYRNFRLGNLVEIVLTDTRIIARDQTDTLIGINAENRTMMGPDQEKWFSDTLTAAQNDGVQYKLVGEQVMVCLFVDLFSQYLHVFGLPTPFSWDSFDGYPANRRRILDTIKNNNIKDVVFVTGDFHASFAFEVAENPFDSSQYNKDTGEGALAVEFLTPPVTSLSPAMDSVILAAGEKLVIKGALPHVKYTDLTKKGYVLLNIAKDKVRSEYWFVNDIQQRVDGEYQAAVFEKLSGSNKLNVIKADW